MRGLATLTGVAALAFLGLLGSGAFADDRVVEFAVPIPSQGVAGDGRNFGDLIFGGEGSDTLKCYADDLTGSDIIDGGVEVDGDGVVGAD